MSESGTMKILRTRAAGTKIGLSESTMEKRRLSGDGPPFVRIGKRAIGYLESDFEAWIQGRRRVQSTSE